MFAKYKMKPTKAKKVIVLKADIEKLETKERNNKPKRWFRG